MRKGRVVGTMVLAALTGCVAEPPPVSQQTLLGAYPGPDKTQAVFAQDDAACQAAATQPLRTGLAGIPTVPPGTDGVTGGISPAPGTGQPGIGQPGVGQPGVGQPGGQQDAAITPGMVYLRCMVVHGDIVQPVMAAQPAGYAYYAPYPVYYGVGDYSPWLYGGAFDYPFFGGFYGGFGFGFGGFGFAHGYGYGRGYGHGGGYGFREGGSYRGAGGYGGGFHEGGGFGGGGFHGGGGHR